MSVDLAEVEKRQERALEAIRRAYGTPADEYGATLFVSHHLKELDSSYWERRLHSPTPEPMRVLDLLVRSPDWNPEEDGVQSVDLTLPDGATNYVLCVRFDESGAVAAISMES